MDKDTLHEVELHIFQMIIDFSSYAGNAFLSGDEEMMNLFKGQHIGLMRLQKWLSEKYLRVCQKEDKEEEQKCKYRCAHGHRFNTPSTQPGKDKEMLRCSICGCPHFEVVGNDGKQVSIHTTIPVGSISDELVLVKMIEFFKAHRFSLEELSKFMAALPKGDEVVEKTYAKYVKTQMATLKDHDHKLFAQIVNGLVTEGWKEDGGSYVYRLLSKDGFAIKVFRHAESPQVIKICFSAEPEEEDG